MTVRTCGGKSDNEKREPERACKLISTRASHQRVPIVYKGCRKSLRCKSGTELGMVVISAYGRQRQEDLEFQARLGYIATLDFEILVGHRYLCEVLISPSSVESYPHAHGPGLRPGIVATGHAHL